MPPYARWFLVPLLSAALLQPALGRDKVPAAYAEAPVAFASDEGFARLTRASGHADFAALANQFEAQSNRGFCGPTTAAIVLNAVHAGSTDAPRDSSRLRPEDLKYAPKGFDLTVPRFTQENVFDKAGKTRAQVFGEPVTINGKPTSDYGFQLRQIDELLRANGLSTKLVVVDDDKPEADIRADLVANLQHADDFVIVNYQRKAIGQAGGAHISPLGAYDAESDSVLILDVNPSAAGWVWVPMTVMIRGMRTFDTVENRGYIQVQRH